MVFFLDTNSGIFNIKHESQVGLIYCRNRESDLHMSLLGKLHRIPNQIDQDLPEPQFINQDTLRKRWIDDCIEYETLFLSFMLEHLDTLLYQTPEVHQFG